MENGEHSSPYRDCSEYFTDIEEAKRRLTLHQELLSVPDIARVKL